MCEIRIAIRVTIPAPKAQAKVIKADSYTRLPPWTRLSMSFFMVFVYWLLVVGYWQRPVGSPKVRCFSAGFIKRELVNLKIAYPWFVYDITAFTQDVVNDFIGFFHRYLLNVYLIAPCYNPHEKDPFSALQYFFLFFFIYFCIQLLTHIFAVALLKASLP